MRSNILALASALACLGVAGCVTPPAPYDYSAFRSEAPHSVLIVPALNNTANVHAADWFLSTISEPVAQRGYYVFPANMVRGVLNENGLADAGLVQKADARRLGGIFGCDAILFVNIDKWDSKYLLIQTTTEVQLGYEIRSCKTNEVLWRNSQSLVYSPQGSSSGNILADLIAKAIISALEKGSPNYMPLARQANAAAAILPGRGLPAGPYLSEAYGNDGAQFPASIQAVSRIQTGPPDQSPAPSISGQSASLSQTAVLAPPAPPTQALRRVYLLDSAYLMGKLHALDSACLASKGPWRNNMAFLVAGEKSDPDLQLSVTKAFDSGYAETEPASTDCGKNTATAVDDLKRQLDALEAGAAAKN